MLLVNEDKKHKKSMTQTSSKLAEYIKGATKGKSGGVKAQGLMANTIRSGKHMQSMNSNQP